MIEYKSVPSDFVHTYLTKSHQWLRYDLCKFYYNLFDITTINNKLIHFLIELPNLYQIGY